MWFFDKFSAEYNIANTIKSSFEYCKIPIKKEKKLSKDDLNKLGNYIAFSDHAIAKIPHNIRIAISNCIEWSLQDAELKDMDTKDFAKKVIWYTKSVSWVGLNFDKEWRILENVFWY